jgi:hypothetical protein
MKQRLLFAVILRQASLFAPVMYQKSTLPSQKTKPFLSDGKQKALLLSLNTTLRLGGA